jgi:hypothetical protein
MDGLAADVDGGEPGGGDDHHFAGHEIADAAQQRGFAGARAPGDEQVAGAFTQLVEGRQEFRRRLDARRPARVCGDRRRLRSLHCRGFGGHERLTKRDAIRMA